MMKLRHGLLISIEGIDASGKETQSVNLAKALEEEGYDVILLSFPNYDTISGQQLRDYFNGWNEMSPSTVQAMMVINRYEAQTRIEDALIAGKIVVCDRYADSSMAYGMADGVNPQWLVDIQHSLVQPDMTVYIDISAEDSFRRKPENRDAFEQRKELLETVRDIYLRASEVLGWIQIDGTLSKEEVGQAILNQVKTRMGAYQ